MGDDVEGLREADDAALLEVRSEQGARTGAGQEDQVQPDTSATPAPSDDLANRLRGYAARHLSTGTTGEKELEGFCFSIELADGSDLDLRLDRSELIARLASDYEL